jgi:hypothetical protein
MLRKRLPLSALLDAHEITALVNAQPEALNPEEYTVISLPVDPRVQVSHRQPDGSYVMAMQVRIPGGLLHESRIVDPRQGSPLDHALGTIPACRMVVRIDRLSPAAQGEIQAQLDAALGHHPQPD